MVTRSPDLDPGLAGLLVLLDSMNAPPMSQGTAEQARAGFRTMTVGVRDPATLAQVRSVEDSTVDGAAGPIKARLYRPEVDGTVPTVLFMHGGGFVIGDIDTHDDQARLVCRDVGAVVVSVDYRLAPEHPFPAPYEDCVAAARWASAHAQELGGDPARLAVAGDSAGGNLSAAVALALRDAGVPLAAQLLIYPATDMTEEGAHASRDANAEGYFLTSDDMRWFGSNYLPEESQRKDPRASVLHADLAGVAPAVVGVAQLDPLHDEGAAYAAALRDAGVPVVLRDFKGMIHGFFGLTLASPAAAAASSQLCADLRDVLAGRVAR